MALAANGCGDDAELRAGVEAPAADSALARALQLAHDVVELPRTPQPQGILAGTLARAHEFAATGAILYSSDPMGTDRSFPDAPIGAMICSGTLIAPDVVLAAGHCQEEGIDRHGAALHYYFSLDSDVSRFGPHVRAFPEDAVRVRHFVAHPDYAAGGGDKPARHQSDLALLFLERPMVGAKPASVLPAELVPALRAGREVLIVGYGRRNLHFLGAGDGGRKTHGRSTLHRVEDFELQIGLGPSDAYKCWGDSGGPTYLATAGGVLHLIGVTSRAAEMTGCRSGGIDTRVDVYRDWIDAEMANACATWRRPACAPGWRQLPR